MGPTWVGEKERLFRRVSLIQDLCGCVQLFKNSFIAVKSTYIILHVLTVYGLRSSDECLHPCSHCHNQDSEHTPPLLNFLAPLRIRLLQHPQAATELYALYGLTSVF